MLHALPASSSARALSRATPEKQEAAMMRVKPQGLKFAPSPFTSSSSPVVMRPTTPARVQLGLHGNGRAGAGVLGFAGASMDQGPG